MKKFLINNLKSVYQGKKILLGVTGSIAAYKSCELVRLFKEVGAEVRLVLSESAEKFVTQTTLQTLSENKVYMSLWTEDPTHQHIDLARWADVVLVAPATANTISKIALGLGSDLLTTEILAFTGNIYIAPAMNPQMYRNQAVARNLKVLSERGIKQLGPAFGETSCGEIGLGRMIEPLEILEQLAVEFFAQKKNKKVLISLGPTRSFLDPVRYLTNRSSGKMGAALAWASVEKGYDVTVVAGPHQVKLPALSEVINVSSSQEMYNAVCDQFKDSDIFISTAAVLDFEFSKKKNQKLKKDTGLPEIELNQTKDILRAVCEQKRENQFVLGFSAETENPVMYAKKKLLSKKCDAVFANKVGDTTSGGFESDDNYGWWISKQVEEFQLQSKMDLARKIVKHIEREIEDRNRLNQQHPLEKIGLRVSTELRQSDNEDHELESIL